MGVVRYKKSTVMHVYNVLESRDVNRKSGFRFENRNPVSGFENWILNLFFYIFFSIKNCITLRRHS